ncbi:MAG: DHH family phosphoesterase [Chloroflexota bacterium]
MQLEWAIASPVTIPSDLADRVGGHPLVARLLVQRGIVDPIEARAFLDPSHYFPAAPSELFGVEVAAKILYDAIQAEQNILVWGDFDVDGQTSTSLLVAGLLKLCESEQIRFHVPNRFTESHGIKPAFLQTWLDDPAWKPHLLLSCDTGIAEAEAVQMAKEHGLTVILTDHHDLTAEFEGINPATDPLWGVDPLHLPGLSVRVADAIVNPKFQPADDPLRTLPGVGVAYKLMQQLYALADITGAEDELLDLVALGIVADVAEQVHDARYLLQLGLNQLRTTQRTGLLALMDVGKVVPANITTDDIGFQLGPRMNALGRLEDATVAVELLTTHDPIRAGQLAATMERLNQQRRLITSQTTGAALEMIDRRPELLDFNGLVLSHPAWHAGIVGIVASRLVEEFNRPVVLMLNPPGEAARGSARSIPGVDIGASIAACSHLLIGHGGHPGAAGLSLLPENIDAFRRELDRQIELHRIDDGPPKLAIDAELTIDEINLELVEQIQRLAPFGNGNPTPNFISSGVRVVKDQRIGREGNHRKFEVQQTKDGKALPVLWFNSGDIELPPEPLDIVYTLNINEFRGERSVQLMYVASRTTYLDAADIDLNAKATLQIIDKRPNMGSQERQSTLFMNHPSLYESLPSTVQATWYAEGINLPDPVSYAPRSQLQVEATTLVLWTIPPSAEVLLGLVEQVTPHEVYICGQRSTDDSLDGVLRHVAGMCKYVLNRQGELSLTNSAARLGTTTSVIRHTLRLLESKGLIVLNEWATDDAVRISKGNGEAEANMPQILVAELEEQLAEVRAYRRFFQRAKLTELLPTK